MQKKRRNYFNNRRTTSHWAYPIRVNGLQAQTYGNDEFTYRLYKTFNTRFKSY